MPKTVPGGVAHDLPEDLRKALRADPPALAIRGHVLGGDAFPPTDRVCCSAGSRTGTSHASTAEAWPRAHASPEGAVPRAPCQPPSGIDTQVSEVYKNTLLNHLRPRQLHVLLLLSLRGKGRRDSQVRYPRSSPSARPHHASIAWWFPLPSIEHTDDLPRMQSGPLQTFRRRIPRGTALHRQVGVRGSDSPVGLGVDHAGSSATDFPGVIDEHDGLPTE